MTIPQEVIDFISRPVDFITYAGHIYHPDGKRHEAAREGAIKINVFTRASYYSSFGWYITADPEGRFFDMYNIIGPGKLKNYISNPHVRIGSQYCRETDVLRDTDDGNIIVVGVRVYRNMATRILAADSNGVLYTLPPKSRSFYGRFSKSYGSSDPMAYYKGGKGFKFTVYDSSRGDARNLELTAMSALSHTCMDLSSESVSEILKVCPKWKDRNLKFTNDIRRLLVCPHKKDSVSLNKKLSDIKERFSKYSVDARDISNLILRDGDYIAYIKTDGWSGNRARVLEVSTGKKYSVNLKSGSPAICESSPDMSLSYSGDIDHIFGGSFLGKTIKNHRKSFSVFSKNYEGGDDRNMAGTVENLMFGKTSRLVEQLVAMDMPNIARMVARERYIYRHDINNYNGRRGLFRLSCWSRQNAHSIQERSEIPSIAVIDPYERNPAEAFGISNRNLRILENLLDASRKNNYNCTSASRHGEGVVYNDGLVCGSPFGLVRFQATFCDVNFRDVDTDTFTRICNNGFHGLLETIHDLNTAYTTVRYSDLGFDTSTRGKTALQILEYLESVYSSGNNLASLYKDVMRISRDICCRMSYYYYGNNFDFSEQKSQFARIGLNLFPRLCDIPYIHDELLRIQLSIEAMRSEESRRQMEKANMELDKAYEKFKPEISKYEFSGDKYLIRKPEKIHELTLEGNFLHHCVGSYRKSVADGQEIILFMRKKSDPEIPWFTIDLTYGGQIRQIHSKNNGNICESQDYESIMKFLNSWADSCNVDKRTLRSSYGARCHL